jgi:hypothetical protein
MRHDPGVSPFDRDPAEHPAGRHLVGLCRVLTDGQDAQVQRDALTEAGCVRIFEEKACSLTRVTAR